MTGRIKLLLTLAPGIIVPVLWCATAPRSSAFGPGPCPAPPPCSPDGVRMPKSDTWGWYQTRWRSFPGDKVSPTPTAAETQKPSEAPEENLRGPQLPDSAKEGNVGPDKPVPGAAGARGAAAPQAAGPQPGAEPAAAPAAEPAVGPGAGPQVEPAPAGTPVPGSDNDPFSSLPPAPPWLVEQTTAVTPSTGNSGRQARVAPAVDVEPAVQPQIEAPDAQSDDAPPEIPASVLDAITGARPERAPSVTSPIANAITMSQNSAPMPLPIALPPVAPQASPKLAQPIAVAPTKATSAADRRIVPASATATPDNVELINPAVALVSDGAEEAAEPAVYFEASDLTGEPSFVQPAAP